MAPDERHGSTSRRVAYAAKALAQYQARATQFHTYIRALASACDLEHRSQLNALVDQMPDDPDAVWSLFDDPGHEIQIEDVARCCRARLALDAALGNQQSGRPN